MPRRLSEVLPQNHQFLFVHRSLQARTTQSMLIGGVISSWAYVEAGFGVILAKFLKANAEAATAMYSSLHGFSSQRKALIAAAEASLEADDLCLLKDVLTAVTPLANLRHHFAHWLWGYCPILENEVLLVEPKMIWKLHGRTEAILNNYDLAQTAPPMPAFDRDRVEVWNSQELMEVQDQIDHAADIVMALSNYYNDSGSGRADIRARIYAQSTVSDAQQDRLRKRSRSNLS